MASRRYLIALFVVAAGATSVAGYLSARPSQELPKNHPPVIDPQSDVADELYLQTLEDIEAGNYSSAGVKLGRVDRAWRGSKNEEQMVRKVKEDLYARASAAVKAKKWADAKGPLDALVVADPNYKDVWQKRKQVERKLGAGAAGKDALASGSSPDQFTEKDRIIDLAPEQKGLPYKEPEEGPAKDIPADAKALSLVARGIPGYKTVQYGLIEGNPNRAGATYLPTDPKTKATVNRIITTVVRTTDALKAEDELKAHKGTYPKNSRELTVNRHDAYFGIYEIGEPKIFPPLATVTWTRGQWFFAVDVVPKAGATVDAKREAGLFVARAWGY